MKTFKEWWEKFKPQIDPDTYNGDEDQIRKAVARCTWRTALEEILKRFEISHSESGIIDWIKDELKDG